MKGTIVIALLTLCTMCMSLPTLPDDTSIDRFILDLQMKSSDSDWHSCKSGLPEIVSVPGIASGIAEGVIDGYTRTELLHNGQPVWRGGVHGFLAYKCSNGVWMFSTVYSQDSKHRDQCHGILALNPDGSWFVWDGVKMIKSTPSIVCGSVTAAPTQSKGWHSCPRRPMIKSVPGILAGSQGLIDTYTRTGDVFNGEPIWRGVKNGALAWKCKQAFSVWMFDLRSATSFRRRDQCHGIMRATVFGKWEVLGDDNKLHTSAVSVSCTEETPTPTEYPASPIPSEAPTTEKSPTKNPTTKAGNDTRTEETPTPTGNDKRHNVTDERLSTNTQSPTSAATTLAARLLLSMGMVALAVLNA